MQTDDAADPKWRKSGHQFKTLPSHVRAHINHLLEIPPLLLHALTPPLATSVFDFLSFKFPPFLRDDDQMLIWSFSKVLPTSDIVNIIPKIPIPQSTVIQELVSEVKQKWLDGEESFEVGVCPGQHLPLWVITYWRKTFAEIIPALQSWGQAVTWLAEVKYPQADFRSAFQPLTTITWSGHLLTGRITQQQTRVQFSKLVLTHFLSHQWLSDDHIDLMLYMLEDKLGKVQGWRDDVRILDTIHTRGIIQAYLDDEDPEKPSYDPTGDGYLQRFGSGLQRKGKLGGIFHSNGNHWVAIVVDLDAEKLLYGDPANGKVNQNLTEAFEWYLGQHIQTLTVLLPDDLKSPQQDLTNDTWNCGLYAYSALAHYFLGKDLFVGSTAVAGDIARIEIFRDLIAHQLELTQSQGLSFITSESTVSNVESTPIDPALLPNFGIPKLTLKISGPRRSTASSKEKNKGVHLAPIFQVPAIVPVVRPKRKRSLHGASSDEENWSHLGVHSDTEPGSDDDGRGSVNSSGSFGRPKSGTLDMFTIDITKSGDTKKKYRCVGHRCEKIFSPRTTTRVLAHCQSCPRLTPQLHQAASAFNANRAPGALVDADNGPKAATQVSTHKAAPDPIPRADLFFGTSGRRKMHNKLDLLITLLFCDARLALRVADNIYWKQIFETLVPTYKPASSSTLMDSHIFSEAERVKHLQIEELREESHVSISFDGGSLRSGESVYTIHATTAAGKVILLEGIDGTGVSHTGRWIAKFVLQAIHTIGGERVTAVASDNTGNTRTARELICKEVPHIFNLPDPIHHLNNTWKDIATLDHFSDVISVIRRTVTHFKHSGHANGLLRKLRQEHKLGPGLESVGKTRFATLVWSAISVQRCLGAIRQLVSNDKVDLGKDLNLHFTNNTYNTLQFEMNLAKFIVVGDPFARAILCLESTKTNPGDVYLYWLALLRRLKGALSSCHLPSEVCGQIRGIVQSRWRDFFIYGPTNVHLTAFYLNPAYGRSSILRNPNPMDFNIKIPSSASQDSPQVPPGISSPNIFQEVAKYGLLLLVQQLERVGDTFLAQWKGKAGAFTKAYQSQFVAYAQRAYPFNAPVLSGQSALQWWKAYEGTINGGILAALAIKVLSAIPHSIADERTMSVITMLNTSLRNRQSVQSVVAISRIRNFHAPEKPRNHRETQRQTPTKFYDIVRVIRGVGEGEETRAQVTDPNYDESDDEDVGGTPSGAVKSMPPSSSTLPVEGDEEVDLEAPELADMLADTPVAFADTPQQTTPVENQATNEEDGGKFELLSWL